MRFDSGVSVISGRYGMMRNEIRERNQYSGDGTAPLLAYFARPNVTLILTAVKILLNR